MRLSPLYQERLSQATQQGERLVVENLLRVRFGELDEELSAIIEPVLALPPEEFTPLLLQLSPQYFFGRESFVERLFQATQTRNFIPLLGASGSGKSSVVLAGLVPRLQQEGYIIMYANLSLREQLLKLHPMYSQ
jgi:hypothetical protein